MFTIFGLTILIGLFSAVPLWVFFVPLLILISACIKFRRRTPVRTACAAIALLISLLAIPFVAVQGYFRMEADERLESAFGVAVGQSRIARYRFVVAGIGDTCDYWKIRKANPYEHMQVISRSNLLRIDSNASSLPGSTLGSPSWWPKSPEGYAVYQGDDSEGGSKEIWIPKEGSYAYLYSFLE